MSEYIMPEVSLAHEAKEALQKEMGNFFGEQELWGFLKGLPSMIVQEGLLQTLAFLRSKDEKKYHKAVYRAIENYASHFLGNGGEFDLINHLISQSFEVKKYIYIENRILEFTIWIKRIGLALYAPEEFK